MRYEKGNWITDCSYTIKVKYLLFHPNHYYILRKLSHDFQFRRLNIKGIDAKFLTRTAIFQSPKLKIALATNLMNLNSIFF